MKAFFRNLNIKSKLTFSILGLMILIFIGLGSVVYFNRIKTATVQADNQIKQNLEEIINLLDLLYKQKLEINSLQNKVEKLLSQVDSTYQANNIVSNSLLNEKEIKILKQLLSKNKYYNTGYVTLIAKDGTVILDSLLEGKNIKETANFKNLIQSPTGKTTYNVIDKKGLECVKWSYIKYFDQLKTYIVITIDEEEVLDKLLNSVMRIFFITFFLTILIFYLFIHAITKNISSALKKLIEILKNYAKGNINEKLDIERDDEIGEISKTINELSDGLKSTTAFANAIERGKFDFQFKPLSNEDMLGNALIDMRKSLQKAAEEERVRKIEDEKRKWATEGLAKFADILRQNNDKIDLLSYSIISNLVKYLKINQGGIFILNDDNENNHFLELTACYAYDRQKYLTKTIKLGEGLVGACFMEQKLIYMTNVPNHYVHITSGLGGENPKSILVVPLAVNEEIYGVIELASFHKFEEHEIEFIQKISESIASTISSAKITAKTAFLLEQSQLQSEQMRAQEEEMRQNMEEMAATQEALAEKERMQIYEIEKLTQQNEQKLKEVQQREIEAQAQAKLLKEQEDKMKLQIDELNKIKSELQHKDNIQKEEIDRLSKEHKNQIDLVKQQEFEIKQNFEQLEAVKQEIEIKSAEMKWSLDTINRAVSVLEFDSNGIIVFANDILLEAVEYNADEVIGKHISMFFGDAEVLQSEGYKEFWEAMNQGKGFKEVLRRKRKSKGYVMLQAISNPLFGLDGKLDKVMEISIDITIQSELLEQSRIQAEELKAQEEELRQNVEELSAIQEELQKKEVELSAQIDSINKTVAVLETNFEGNIIHVNDIFCRLLGYSRSELLGKNYNIFLENQNNKHSEEFNKFWDSMRKGKTFDSILKRKTKNGQLLHFQCITNPIFDSNNEPIKIMELSIDITRQVELLSELKDQTEKLKIQELDLKNAMIEMSAANEALHKKEVEMSGVLTAINNSIATIELDLMRNIIECNTKFGEIFNVKPSEIIGKDYYDFCVKERVNTAEYRTFWKEVTSGTPKSGEFMKTTPIGNIWVHETFTPVKNEQNQIYKIICFVNDITERKKAENIQKAILGILEDVNTVDTLDELYKSIHTHLSTIIMARNFYIALIDKEKDLVTFAYFVDEKQSNAPAARPMKKGLSEYVFRNGKGHLIMPTDSDRLVEEGEFIRVGSPSECWLGVPLKTKDKIFGIMAVQSYTPGLVYDENDLNIFNFVSEQIALTIDRKKSEEELKKKK